FLKTFAVMALLPAISEELFFRGIIMRMVHQRVGKVIHAILLSAIIFALMHGNPMGFVSIIIAGAILAAVYYLTGSLWLSMLAHLLNNGLQIILIYLGTSNKAIQAFIDSDSIPLPYVAAGI